METRRSSLMPRVLRAAHPVLLAALALTLGGCQVVKAIFGAGMGVGIALVLGLVVVVGGIVALVSHKG